MDGITSLGGPVEGRSGVSVLDIACVQSVRGLGRGSMGFLCAEKGAMVGEG